VLVDLAGSDVVVAGEGDVEVTLVVAEIEIDFTAVGEDKDFAVPARCSVCCTEASSAGLSVLLRVHSPCVYIEVGIDLDRGHVRRLSVKPGSCVAALALILRPIVLSSRPVEEAVTRGISVYTRRLLFLHRILPIMPYMLKLVLFSKFYMLYALTFPTPLITPPDTSTYFIIAFSARATVWGREGRNLKGRGASQEICSVPLTSVGGASRRTGANQDSQVSRASSAVCLHPSLHRPIYFLQPHFVIARVTIVYR
jgi:hypothetical protein